MTGGVEACKTYSEEVGTSFVYRDSDASLMATVRALSAARLGRSVNELRPSNPAVIAILFVDWAGDTSVCASVSPFCLASLP